MDNIEKMQEPMSDKNPMWEAHDIEMDDKATEDIRDGIAKGMGHTDDLEWGELPPAIKGHYLSEADRIINYLKSQNVFRLADNQELPKYVGDGSISHKLTAALAREVQQDMIEAKYRKVVNLDGTEL